MIGSNERSFGTGSYKDKYDNVVFSLKQWHVTRCIDKYLSNKHKFLCNVTNCAYRTLYFTREETSTDLFDLVHTGDCSRLIGGQKVLSDCPYCIRRYAFMRQISRPKDNYTHNSVMLDYDLTEYYRRKYPGKKSDLFLEYINERRYRPKDGISSRPKKNYHYRETLWPDLYSLKFTETHPRAVYYEMEKEFDLILGSGMYELMDHMNSVKDQL